MRTRAVALEATAVTGSLYCYCNPATSLVISVATSAVPSLITAVITVVITHVATSRTVSMIAHSRIVPESK